MIWQFKVVIITSVLLAVLGSAGQTFFKSIPRSWYLPIGACGLILSVISLVSLIWGILAT